MMLFRVRGYRGISPFYFEKSVSCHFMRVGSLHFECLRELGANHCSHWVFLNFQHPRKIKKNPNGKQPCHALLKASLEATVKPATCPAPLTRAAQPAADTGAQEDGRPLPVTVILPLPPKGEGGRVPCPAPPAASQGAPPRRAGLPVSGTRRRGAVSPGPGEVGGRHGAPQGLPPPLLLLRARPAAPAAGARATRDPRGRRRPLLLPGVGGKGKGPRPPLASPASCGGGNGFGLRQLNGGKGRGEACGAALLQPQRAGAVGYTAAHLPFADGEPALIRWIRVVPLCGLCVGQNVSVAFLGG